MNEEIDKYSKLASLGLPIKSQLASMLGQTPQAQYGYDFLERQLLKIGIERWTNPLVSSAVQSGNPSDTGGAPEKDPEDLSDEGVNTRDKK